jgi:PIN domain nuclease of toxin-antitoxin system
MNGLLLDTHVLLWWLQGSRRIGARARALIDNPESVVWVSAATAWEMAIKSALGRLDLGEALDVCLPRELQANGFRPLAVSVVHAVGIGRLPAHHRDPFDRLLIAQALTERLTIVTADPVFAAYGIDALDART